MPIGVEVDIEDDEATVAFTDRTRKGPGLNALLKVGGPENVRKITLPREAYVVPVWVARDAGLTDDAPAPVSPDADTANGDNASGGTGDQSPNADDGLPDMDWSRAAINAYATEHGVEGAEAMSKKQDVLDAIAAKAAGESAPSDEPPSDPASSTDEPTGDAAPGGDDVSR